MWEAAGEWQYTDLLPLHAMRKCESMISAGGVSPLHSGQDSDGKPHSLVSCKQPCRENSTPLISLATGTVVSTSCSRTT